MIVLLQHEYGLNHNLENTNVVLFQRVKSTKTTQRFGYSHP